VTRQRCNRNSVSSVPGGCLGATTRFSQLIDFDTTVEEFLVVMFYRKQGSIELYDDEFRCVPITSPHQPEQNGLTHALLAAKEHIEDDFMLMLGHNVFRANLGDVVRRQRGHRTDAAFLVEEVPWEEAGRYGVCDTNDYGEIVEVIEKPEEPPTNLVMTGFYTFSSAIFHAAHLVQPSNRDEYELSEAIDLLIRSGRTIDAIRMDGWRSTSAIPRIGRRPKSACRKRSRRSKNPTLRRPDAGTPVSKVFGL
jgi:dTDP-glucose pyrophosphorylase